MEDIRYGLITEEDIECINEMADSNYDKVTEARSAAGAAGGAAGGAAAK